MLFPAVDLALPVTEPRLVAAGAQSKRPRRSSFGLTGEEGWDGHRGRARVVLFSCGDLPLFVTVVRVDGVFEARPERLISRSSRIDRSSKELLHLPY